MKAAFEQPRLRPRPPLAVRPARPPLSQVTLEYPKTWAVILSPHAHEMERRTEAWLEQSGICCDAESAKKLRDLSVAEYANWPFPLASEERAEVITKFLTLWIFYEDLIEEADDGQQRAVGDAIRGSSKAAAGDRYLRCWSELGRAYAGAMGRDWLDRHASRFEGWVASVRTEREAANELRRTGVFPDTGTHLRRRSANIGMMRNLDFLEYQMGWELPEQVLRDPMMQAVERCAAEAVAIMNDVYGFTNDRQNRFGNLVASAMQEFEMCAEDAFRWSCNLHNAKVREVVRHQNALEAKYSHIRELSAWFDGLHYMVFGFARWHSRARRYRTSHDVDGRQINIEIETTRDDVSIFRGHGERPDQRLRRSAGQ